MKQETHTSQSINPFQVADPRTPALPATILATPDATEGRIALFEIREGRGDGPPLYRHSRHDELVFVLQRRVTFYLGRERIKASTGSSVVLPRGTEHGYVIESDAARLLVVLAPAERGLEELLGDMSRCAKHPTVDPEPESAHDIERLISKAARFGVEITRPRPNGA
jgi:quercetin dioxygenase-like cupin family protein